MGTTFGEELAVGLKAYREGRKMNQDREVTRQKMQSQKLADALTRQKISAYNEPLQKGLIRAGDKVMVDPNHLNPLEEAQMGNIKMFQGLAGVNGNPQQPSVPTSDAPASPPLGVVGQPTQSTVAPPNAPAMGGQQRIGTLDRDWETF